MIKIINIVLIGFLVFCASGYTQELDLEMEYLFTLGENIKFGEPGYLHMAQSATTDSKGNIFISDNQGRIINMYSSSGEYLKNFGRQGRGPGEFNHIDNIAIDENDRLLVLDRFQFKVSRFDVESDSIDEHLFEDMSQINMMTLVPLKNNLLTGIYVESGPHVTLDDETKAIRIYKFGEGEMVSSLFEIFKYQFDADIPAEKRFGSGVGHFLSKLSDTELVVGHNVYFGAHYILNIDSGEVKAIVNNQLGQDHYHLMDPEDRPTEVQEQFAGSISGGDSSGPFYYQILHQSMINAGIDEKLFHVYRKNEKEGYEFTDYLEVFSGDGELILHRSISDFIPLPEEVQFRNYLHLDEKGRLVVLDLFELDDPKISVYQLTLNSE